LGVVGVDDGGTPLLCVAQYVDRMNEWCIEMGGGET